MPEPYSQQSDDLRFARAVDPETLLGDFQAYLSREYPLQGYTLSECEVLKVAFRHDADYEFRYRVCGTDRNGRPFVQILTGNLPDPGAPAGNGHVDRTAPGANGAVTNGWKNSSYCEEVDLVLRPLPHGCKIAGLATALQPDWVRERALLHREALGIADGESIADVRIDPVKVRPAKHCLIRYHLDLKGGDLGPRSIAIYAKVYRKRSAKVAYEAMQLTWSSLARREGTVDIPRPVLWDDATCSLWTTDWGGTRLAGDHGSEWTRIAEPGVAERIATLMAELHMLPFETLGCRGPGREDMLESMRENAEQIAKLHPEMKPRIERLVALFEATDREAGTRRSAFVHGSFKLSQLLTRNDRLGLVDFDWASQGDPHNDIGEFAASLYYLYVTNQAPLSTVQDIMGRFAKVYRSMVPWEYNSRAAAWATGVFLLGKIQHSLKGLQGHTDVELLSELDFLITMLGRML